MFTHLEGEFPADWTVDDMMRAWELCRVSDRASMLRDAAAKESDPDRRADLLTAALTYELHADLLTYGEASYADVAKADATYDTLWA